MPAHRLILVTGPSGAGKTTLAGGLGPTVGLPVFHKDDLKEVLFDAFPAASAEERGRFGIASFAMLERVARAALPYGGAIVEANFDGRFASEPWRRLVAETGAEACILELTAPVELLTERANLRGLDGSRHPGHATRPAARDIVLPVPLALGVPTLRLDATRSPDALLDQSLDWLAACRRLEP